MLGKHHHRAEAITLSDCAHDTEAKNGIIIAVDGGT